jgi:hypothetical protein
MRWRGLPGFAALTADCSVSDATQPITGARNPLEFPVSRSFLRCRGLPRPVPVSGDKSFLRSPEGQHKRFAPIISEKLLVHTPIHISSAVIPRRKGFSTGPSTVLSTASRRSRSSQATVRLPLPVIRCHHYRQSAATRPGPASRTPAIGDRWVGSTEPRSCPSVTVSAWNPCPAGCRPESFRTGSQPDDVCVGGAPRSMCDYLPYGGGDVPSTMRELSTYARGIRPGQMRA